jgi:hypothetical protein
MLLPTPIRRPDESIATFFFQLGAFLISLLWYRWLSPAYRRLSSKLLSRWLTRRLLQAQFLQQFWIVVQGCTHLPVLLPVIDQGDEHLPEPMLDIPASTRALSGVEFLPVLTLFRCRPPSQLQGRVCLHPLMRFRRPDTDLFRIIYLWKD